MRGSSPSRMAVIAARDGVDRAREAEIGERVGLRLHAGGIGGLKRVGAEVVAGGADDQELAEVRQQIAAELRDVAARSRESFARLQGGATIAFRDRVGRGEDQGGVGDAQNREHVFRLDALAPVGDELIERAESVAEAPGRRAGDRRDGAVVDLDRFSRCDAAERPRRSVPARGARSRSAGSDRRWWA